jgi:hypothetical protein
MLAYRANEAAFAAIEKSVNVYLDHWFNLAENGLATETTAEALAERDRRNRAILFSPEVDPVWEKVDRLVGAEMSARLRRILQSQTLEE